MDFEDAARELYRLPLAEFTAARNAAAAEARRIGALALADSLKALKKPTLAAWALNRLADRKPEELRRLVQLAPALRSAQETLAGDEIRRLSRQRVELIGSLSEATRALAIAAGQPLSGAARVEVEETLEAAVLDEELAGLLQFGRLTSSRRSAGLANVGFGEGHPSGDSTRTTGPNRVPTRVGAGDRAAEDRQRHRMAQASQREREQAERELERVQEKLGRALDQLERLRAEEAKAMTRLRDAQAAESSVTRVRRSR